MSDMNLSCEKCSSEFFIVSSESELSDTVCSFKCKVCGTPKNLNEILDFSEPSGTQGLS